MMKTIFVSVLVSIAFAAQVAQADVYADALASPSRLEADAARDAGRKPDEVLAFFGIGPDMVVLDMFSGGGYYAEILSEVVGDDGRVVAHSNSAYLKFVGDEFKARHAEGRMPNVDVLMAENNELQLDANQFDAITMVLAFHDTYWINPEGGWPEIDRVALNAELFASLKPGGVLGIVDHYAAAGASSDTGSTVHRIDRAIAVADFEAAGFVLESESDILRNPDDDYSKGVFSEGIRGNTDRFVLLFRKPE
jgi:predicted methyltransferase